jgi:hypothetical protein
LSNWEEHIKGWDRFGRRRRNQNISREKTKENVNGNKTFKNIESAAFGQHLK